MKIARRELILLVVLGALLAGVGLYYTINWYTTQLRAAQTELDATLADLNKVEEKVRNLESIRQKLDDVRQQELDYDQLVPRSEEVPQLLRDTATILTSAGVKLNSFIPQAKGTPVASVPEFSQLGVAINATGTYDDLLHMFDALRSWRRLIGIKDFSINSSTGKDSDNSSNNVKLGCQFDMVVFYTGK